MQFFKRVSVLGMITGSIVGVVGRTIVLLVIGSFIGILLAASGSGVPANVNDIGYTDPFVLSITLLVMSLFSMLGGYIAAYLAKHDELLNSALSSFLAMLLAVCSISTDPLYLAMFTLISSPLLAMLGGYLRLKQQSRKQMMFSEVNLESDLHLHVSQPEHTLIHRSSKSQRRTAKLSPLIQLTGFVIVIGVIWSLWFGWSLASFVGPGLILLLGYRIYRLFRKDSPRPADRHPG